MPLTLPRLFGRKSAPLVGIDVSSHSVKVVELGVGAKAAMRLERYAIEPIERGAMVEGVIEKPEVVAEALTRALRRCSASAKEAALALPSQAVITKRILLTAGLSEEEYEFQVESEASQYIPFPLDEVNLDFQILGLSANNPDEVDVLLAASRKEKVDERVAVAEMSGLKPVIVDVEPYAIRSAIEHVAGFLPEGGDGKVIAVVLVGDQLTKVTIMLNGETIFEREQGFGGVQLTQDIVRLYGLSFDEAEQKKRSGDLPDNYREDVLKPFVALGAADITRAFQFFFTSTPFAKVDQVFLAGGSAVVPGLCEAVAERTQVVTDLVNPFQGMEIAESIRDRQLRIDAPSLLVAVGLAMRRFDS